MIVLKSGTKLREQYACAKAGVKHLFNDQKTLRPNVRGSTHSFNNIRIQETNLGHMRNRIPFQFNNNPRSCKSGTTRS